MSDFDLSHAAQNKLDELAGLALVKVATVVFIVLAPYPVQDVVNDIILRIRSLLLLRLLLMHLATPVEVVLRITTSLSISVHCNSHKLF